MRFLLVYINLPLFTSLFNTKTGNVSAENASALGNSFEDKAMFLANLAISNETSLANFLSDQSSKRLTNNLNLEE